HVRDAQGWDGLYGVFAGELARVRDQEFLAYGRAHVRAHLVEPVVERAAPDRGGELPLQLVGRAVVAEQRGGAGSLRGLEAGTELELPFDDVENVHRHACVEL